jgi:hypothetical protein
LEYVLEIKKDINVHNMTEDFIHEYLGFGRVPSKCRVMIFSDDGDNFICFEDLGEGTSVTNASEDLATEIVDKMDYDPANCRFFETYRIKLSRDKKPHHDTFDEINYQWSFNRGRWIAKEPKWNPASEEIKNLFIN